MRLSARLSIPLPLYQTVKLPSLVKLQSAAKRVLDRWPDVVRDPPERDRERIIQELKRRLDQNDWENTKLSFVTMAAKIAFDADWRDRPDLGDVRRFYYEETRLSNYTSFLSGMFSVYVSTYSPGAEHTKQLAMALKKSQAHLGGRWRAVLDKTPECLQPAQAHKVLCKKIQGSEKPWEEIRDLGFLTVSAPGLVEHVHYEFVKAIRPELFKREYMERLIGWLKPDENAPPRVNGAHVAVAALLEPWMSEDPVQSDQSYLVESLLGLYGDPRVQRVGVWAIIPEQVLDVMLRWLTREDIEFFLRVVTQVEQEHLHKWMPRRDFWLRLYKEGRIDAAWVAFSYDAELEAKKISNRIRDNDLVSYGRQTDGGIVRIRRYCF
ncbi:EH signature domain-containing protein [Neopusillimonas aromaticivorans]|uniref:EH signature domain-containing protein n=1 Tax=Neopusillimonas aromaticivorans TaxID=2979868 RepID=UPI00259AA1FE|nr:EH signature domain-containing protein [Neopusillimonas aromaticivorans]WJJ93801.1 EH signature domain-containing protein [Neopusillimonas aromaticivorans]